MDNERFTADGQINPRGAWLAPEELAQILHIPLNTVYSWRRNGKGPVGYKLGRHVRYAPSDVIAYLDTTRDDRAKADRPL